MTLLVTTLGSISPTGFRCSRGFWAHQGSKCNGGHRRQLSEFVEELSSCFICFMRVFGAFNTIGLTLSFYGHYGDRKSVV